MGGAWVGPECFVALSSFLCTSLLIEPMLIIPLPIEKSSLWRLGGLPFPLSLSNSTCHYSDPFGF